MLRKLIALFLILVVLGGCTGTGDSPRVADSDMTGQPEVGSLTTIRVFAGPSSDPVLSTLIRAFHAAEPQIRVESVGMQIPTGERVSYLEVIQDVLGRSEADVFLVAGKLSDLIDSGQVLPLDPFLQRDSIDLRGFGPLLDGLRVKGSLYDLPYRLNPSIIMYRKELFERAELPVPKPGWTWEEFRWALSRLTEGEGERKTWGFSSDDLEILALAMARENLESRAMDPTTAKTLLEYWGTLVQGDKTVAPLPHTSRAGEPRRSSLRHYQDGQAGMTVSSLTTVAMYGQGQLILPPTSQGNRGTLSVLPPDTLAISAKTKVADAAWKFIRFSTGPEGAIALATAGYLPAYHSDAVRQAWMNRAPAPPPETEGLFSVRYVPLYPRNRTQASVQIDMAFDEALTKVLQSDTPWEEAYRTFLAQRDAILAEER